MLFPDYTDPDVALTDLAEAIAAAPTVPINPLPCDRWIARSCLQKAIRRAEPELAQRALGNLFEHDRRAVWRHLTIIALEDVGVANIRALEWIVVAHQNRNWREDHGDWPVMATLVRQMAVTNHCQAACDLLLRALNDPALNTDRAAAIEMDAATLAQIVWDTSTTIETKAIAAMALGGGLAAGQRFNDPFAVFDILDDAGRSSQVLISCRAAWKLSRNPMAFLLPIIWEYWAVPGDRHVIDDALPPVRLHDGVPGYALDQFTRVGNAVARSLLVNSPEIATLLAAAGVPSGKWVETVGDLLFLSEGGLLRRRLSWTTGDLIRLPHRRLPNIDRLGPFLDHSLRLLQAKADQIDSIRSTHLHTAKNKGATSAA